VDSPFLFNQPIDHIFTLSTDLNERIDLNQFAAVIAEILAAGYIRGVLCV
jgi:hypothetical protein